MARLAFLFLALAGMSCNAQSQEAAESASANNAIITTDKGSLNTVSNQLFLSRQNAITQAVEKASPAVVSVNVIGVERFQYNDPFAGDPWMEYFFGRRK